MAFPIAAVLTGASFLLERLPSLASLFGQTIPAEAISGARLALELGPKAIQFAEDLAADHPDVYARWAAARDAVVAGNKAWDAAKPD